MKDPIFCLGNAWHFEHWSGKPKHLLRTAYKQNSFQSISRQKSLIQGVDDELKMPLYNVLLTTDVYKINKWIKH